MAGISIRLYIIRKKVFCITQSVICITVFSLLYVNNNLHHSEKTKQNNFKKRGLFMSDHKSREVYFTGINRETTAEEIQHITRNLLEHYINDKNIKLERKVPLKVHFGEKGNHSYVKQENYEGIIDYLEENGIETFYIETSVMYGGQRHNRKLHMKTAEEHGFNRVPVVIADGEHGENFKEIEINKKHYKSCKIARDLTGYDQVIVLSHFKGHMLAGFGGALKQLSMGYASKGGKLAMHMGIKPRIISRKCRKCNLCKTRCNEDAITIRDKSYIDHDKCVGCGACVSICPHKAVSIISLKSIAKMLTGGREFREKLAEYAYASDKDRKNLYINFAMTITAGCDCEPRKMKPLMDDIGVFISTDPVAVDKACYDAVKEKGKKFKGTEIFPYAEKMGIGSADYILTEIKKDDKVLQK